MLSTKQILCGLNLVRFRYPYDMSGILMICHDNIAPLLFLLQLIIYSVKAKSANWIQATTRTLNTGYNAMHRDTLGQLIFYSESCHPSL